jgi:hypothetical protein
MMDNTQWWYTLGKLCGYPDCCVLAFSLREVADVPNNFEYSGFVPCNRCANHANSFLTELIAKNRDRRLHKFPNDIGLEELARKTISKL